MQSINSNFKVTSPVSRKLRQEADRHDSDIAGQAEGIVDRLDALKTYVVAKDNSPEDKDPRPGHISLKTDERGQSAALWASVSPEGTKVHCGYPELGYKAELGPDGDRDYYFSNRFENNQEVVNFDNTRQTFKIARSSDTDTLTVLFDNR